MFCHRLHRFNMASDLQSHTVTQDASLKGSPSAPSRRDFLIAGVAAGTGLVIGFYLPHKGNKGVFAPNAYLRIAPDGKITVLVARPEMGRGVWTCLPMILPEHVESDWKQIAIQRV